MTYTSIKDKVAIVTGAGEGIGFAICEKLVTLGAKVVLNDVDTVKANMASEALNNIVSGACIPFTGDAGTADVVDRLVDVALQEYNRIDFVIPNAGITLFGSFLDFSSGAFNKVLQVNLHGAFFLVQRAAKEMIQQGSGGRVVLMSSQVGIRAYRNLTAYGMTKAALEMMGTHLAYELGEYGITVNTIAPGAILTERTSVEHPNYEALWSQLNPNRRVGKPEDVANLCMFLLSKNASHINGQLIPVDGGWSTGGKYPDDLI